MIKTMRNFQEIVVFNKYANWTMCVGMLLAQVEADYILTLIQIGICFETTNQ